MKSIDLGLAVLVMAVWGLNFAISKTGLEVIPPLTLMATRFALVALLLVPFVPRPRGRYGEIFVISVLLGGLHFPLMMNGLAGIDAATASVAIQLQVPFAALLAALVYKDKLGWRRALGMVVAFAGIVVIAGEPRLRGNLVPLMLVIGASFIWAVANIQIKRLGEIDGFVLNGWTSLFAVPQLVLASLLMEQGQWAALTAPDWRGWTAVVYMAVMVTILGYGLWYPLVRRYDVNQTMPFTLLVPVFGVTGGVLLLDEPLTLGLIAGGSLTLLGVAIIVLRRPRIFTRGQANTC